MGLTYHRILFCILSIPRHVLQMIELVLVSSFEGIYIATGNQAVKREIGWSVGSKGNTKLQG